MADNTIDWKAVEAAMRRGKYGTMRPGDQELCERAWKSDPERYGEQHDQVRDEIIAAVRSGFPCKDGG